MHGFWIGRKQHSRRFFYFLKILSNCKIVSVTCKLLFKMNVLFNETPTSNVERVIIQMVLLL